MTERYRQEITEWSTPNHIYITEGRVLLGYIPAGSSTETRFSSPKKLWSVTGRKFRDLTKKEILTLKENTK